jgi:hypothetical protein
MRSRTIQYSAAELQFVEANCTQSRRVLHAAFVETFGRTDVSVDHLKSLCTRKGWGVGRRPWSEADDAQLRALYADHASTDVAAQIGRSLPATYGRAKQLGLGKSEAFYASPAAGRLGYGENVGAAHRFTKGHVPTNKGKPMPFHPNSAATRFQKGQRGSKWVPIGSERVVDGYRYTKTTDVRCASWTVNWRATHIVRWEALHGPVPEGMALKSLDGDRSNVDPSNWTVVPRGMLARLHGKSGRNYDGAPADLKPTIMAVAKLEHAVAERRRA